MKKIRLMTESRFALERGGNDSTSKDAAGCEGDVGCCIANVADDVDCCCSCFIAGDDFERLGLGEAGKSREVEEDQFSELTLWRLATSFGSLVDVGFVLARTSNWRAT